LARRAQLARKKLLYLPFSMDDQMAAVEMSQPEFGLRHLLAVNALREGLPNPDPEALKLVSDALTPGKISALDAMLDAVYQSAPPNAAQ
jgi:hypothetical protein